ncbi:MAG: glycosyltransferase, partial [Alphaproteobacteria bacterium]|nr:glycosyltransferase [Alphaproteobacteria bacterium]
GAGDMKCFDYLMKLKDKVAELNLQAAKRIFVFRGYKDEFAYAIQLASDFYMMPCRFEPCGLTQMEAMAKGSLPVAMSTGGLVDTIDDGVDGFRTSVFFGNTIQIYGSEKDGKRLKNNTNAYAEVLVKALDVFENNSQKLQKMAESAMRKDFSWDVENSGIHLYYKLLTTGHL